MRIALWTFLLIIIQTVSIDAGFLDRNKRANPPTTEPAIRQILKRHLPLGRVFNALYLQMELADKKIDGLDVVAGVFNFKDRSSLEKLVSLKVDGLAGQLKELDDAVKAVPDGIGQIADVNLIDEKYKVVLDVDEKKRKAMIDAQNTENIPKFLGENQLHYVNMLSQNSAEQICDTINTIGNEKTFSNDLMNSLREQILTCQQIITDVSVELKTIVGESEKSLNFLVGGANISTEVIGKSDKFAELLNLLTNAQQESIKLKSLKDLKLTETNQNLKLVDSVLMSTEKVNPEISIGSSFISERNLSRVFQDLEDGWLKTLLSGDGDFEQFKMIFKDFRSVSDHLRTIQEMENMFSKHNYLNNLKKVTKFISNVESFSKNSLHFDNLGQCLTVSKTDAPASLTEIQSLSSEFESFYKGINDIKQKFDDKSDLSQLYQGAGTHSPNKVEARKNFTEWKTGKQFKEMKAFFCNLKPFFKFFQQNDEFFAIVKSFSEVHSKIDEVQKWISGIKLIKPECDPVFKYSLKDLRTINEIPDSVTKIISSNYILKVQEWIETLPKFQNRLKFFNDYVKKSLKVSSKVLSLKFNRANLLEVAFATRSLEIMSKIEDMKADFERFYDQGALVNITYEYEKEEKKALYEAWGNFKGVKEELEKFQEVNSLALSSMNSTPEKNLEEVGFFYYHLLPYKFYKHEELRKMRETLILLKNPNAKLERALNIVEELSSQNWYKIQATFWALPNILRDLQKEFDEFFGNINDSKNGNSGKTADCGTSVLVLLVGYLIFG